MVGRANDSRRECVAGGDDDVALHLCYYASRCRRSGVTSAINNIEGNLVDSRAMIPAPNDRSVATIKWCSGGVVGCEVVPELG